VKLIGLDLDGTLINPDESISEATISYLKHLVEGGLYIAIVTGRPYNEACYLLERNGLTPALGFPHFLICEERDIYSLKDANHYESWEPRNSELLAKERSLLLQGNEAAARLAEEHQLPFFINNKVLQQGRGFVEITFSSREAAQEGLEKVRDIAFEYGLNPIRNNRGLAFRHKEVGKLHALRLVAEYVGAADHEVLAVGDSHNDLGMLTSGFYGATTNNADRDIKEAVLSVGGYVSSKNASEGVADILKVRFAL